MQSLFLDVHGEQLEDGDKSLYRQCMASLTEQIFKISVLVNYS